MIAWWFRLPSPAAECYFLQEEIVFSLRYFEPQCGDREQGYGTLACGTFRIFPYASGSIDAVYDKVKTALMMETDR